MYAKNINSLFFAIILMKHENQKEIVLLLKPTTKNKSTKWKIQRRFFHMCTLAAWRCLLIDCKYLLEKIPFFKGNCVQFESLKVWVKF